MGITNDSISIALPKQIAQPAWEREYDRTYSNNKRYWVNMTTDDVIAKIDANTYKTEEKKLKALTKEMEKFAKIDKNKDRKLDLKEIKTYNSDQELKTCLITIGALLGATVLFMIKVGIEDTKLTNEIFSNFLKERKELNASKTTKALDEGSNLISKNAVNQVSKEPNNWWIPKFKSKSRYEYSGRYNKSEW